MCKLCSFSLRYQQARQSDLSVFDTKHLIDAIAAEAVFYKRQQQPQKNLKEEVSGDR